jgi:hypothetical protein
MLTIRIIIAAALKSASTFSPQSTIGFMATTNTAQISAAIRE